MLSNKKAYLNIAIEPGKLTTSDHLPLIIRISTKPIIKSIEKRRSFTKAYWEKYRDIISEKTNDAIINNSLEGREINKEKIDGSIGNWIGIIDEAAEEAIPKIKITYYIHGRESDYLKLLENQYNLLRNINGWTREQRELIRNIQEQLKEENLRLYREVWSNKIRKLNNIYNDPTRFWKETQKLMGGGTIKTPYIKDNRGNKIYDTNEKERKFREI